MVMGSLFNCADEAADHINSSTTQAQISIQHSPSVKGGNGRYAYTRSHGDWPIH